MRKLLIVSKVLFIDNYHARRIQQGILKLQILNFLKYLGGYLDNYVGSEQNNNLFVTSEKRNHEFTNSRSAAKCF